MDQYDRYSPGTHVVNKSNGRSYSVLRDYGEGPSRTLEVKTTSGATLAIAAVSVRKDTRPFPETSTPTQPQTPKVSCKETIYQHTKEDGSVVYGTYLATDKMGQVLLKLSGNEGLIITVDPKTVEEVRPYTFSAVGTTSGTVYEFIYIPDVIKAGDQLIPESGTETLRVLKINTRSRSATERFKGRRVATEELLS
jgi:hypothetical protein